MIIKKDFCIYKCVWCKAEHSNLEKFKQHSAGCIKHPAVIKFSRLKIRLNELILEIV
jgi:hypothetical protein